jgi:hypothetical protein
MPETGWLVGLLPFLLKKTYKFLQLAAQRFLTMHAALPQHASICMASAAATAKAGAVGKEYLGNVTARLQ